MEPVAVSDDVDARAVSTSWRGHVVRVQAVVVPRYLFTTADITVDVDGATVLHTGGQKKVTGVVRETFAFAGERSKDHTVELAWGLGAPQSGFPVTVRIDGAVVFDQAPVPIKNRWLVFVPIVVAPVVVITVLQVLAHFLR